jgi:signal transduction histidine kinase/ligand-binding sensor domain-containing protein
MKFGGGLRTVGGLLVFSAALGAQTPQPARVATDRWVLDRWSSDQGLRQNTITSMVQTPDGYLWLGTFGGLVRFDGVRFTEFTTRHHPGLGSDRVMILAAGRHNELWIGTDRGLVRLASGEFREWTERDGRPAGHSNGLYADSTGLWLTGSVGGLARFDGVRFERFGAPGHPDRMIGSIFPDRDGNLWISRGGGRIAVRRPSGVFDTLMIAAGGISSAEPQLHDRYGNLWTLTETGPHRWTGKSLEPFAIRGGGWIYEDGAGGYWLHNSRGVFHRDSAGHADSLLAADHPALRETRGLFVDREGTLWIRTTTYGLLRLRRRLFDMVMREDGLAVEQVTAILRNDLGELWVGSSCDKTTVFSKGTARNFQHPGCVFSLAQTADGIMWGGSFAGGLNRVERSGRFTRLVHADGLPNMVVLALHADPDTSLWIGTENGLGHLRHGVIRTYTVKDGLPAPQIHFITRDRRGALWVGTEGGLARLDGERFRSWTTADGLPHNYVRAVYQDADGIYWIGTYGGGLARFDGSTFVAISSREGLYDDVVSSILEDANGYLWMGGNRGVYRVHRRMLNDFARGAIPQVVCVGYGPSDGLLTPETNGGFQPSAWQDRDGRLWFATVRGLATVHPRDAAHNTSVPSVVVEGVSIDGSPAPTAGEVTLAAGSRYLEIRYAGLTSIAPELLLFRYRMEPIDTGWVYVGDRRTAYFSQLPPGAYHFTVSAASRDGVWNETGQSISFVVDAPWYAAWWFRVILAAAVAGGIALYVRARLARAHEQQRIQREFARQLLTGQETERRRLAGELHDSLGQDLLVMKNRATMALRSGLDAAARAHIEEISAVASHAVQNAREISHALRPYQLDHFGLVEALRDLAEHASVGGGFTARLESDAEVTLDPDAATHVYRIAQEALNNILKHADAHVALITLRSESNGVRLRISDDGKGTDVGRAMGFGLTGMAQRAQILGATFDVRSTPGAGTTIEVFVQRPAVKDRDSSISDRAVTDG